MSCEMATTDPQTGAEEEDEFEEEIQTPEIQGYLTKWTNYIHGWQDRYIVLKDGILSYYKYEAETAFGCRGAVSISKAIIVPHAFDECRFDVHVNDNVWYLRARSVQEQLYWVQTLETYKADSGFGSEQNLRKHGSLVSLTSGNSASVTSVSSLKRGKGLREKLAEMETFRDILLQQVDTLQRYFDSCADEVTHPNDSRMSPDILDIDDFDDENVEEPHFTGVRHRDKGCTHESLAIHASHSIDFRGEAITFKATTAGILETLSFCIDLVAQREELWRRRVEKEVDRRKKAEELYKQAHEKLDEAKNTRPIVLGGPDYEEGPYCAIGEDEFFDAIDAALDKQDKEDELLLRHRNVVALPSAPPPLPMPSKTRLTPEIDKMVAEHINLLRAGCGLNKGNWECIADDGGMKVYRLELEEDGLVLDPLRAVQTVQGVTAHELCHYFYDPSIRMDWDLTLDSSRVIETLSPDTSITHQVHRRVWPSTARDSLFWSQIRQVRDEEDEEAQPIWMVVNYSTEHPSCPVVKCVRIHLNVAFICQTMIDPPSEVEQLTRDHIRTRITYTADVNPGGWAPATVIRAVYKREYPRFVKRFSQFVKDVTANKPILF